MQDDTESRRQAVAQHAGIGAELSCSGGVTAEDALQLGWHQRLLISVKHRGGTRLRGAIRLVVGDDLGCGDLENGWS